MFVRISVLFSLLFAPLGAVVYEVDKPHSSIEFKVRHMLVSNTKGTFNRFSGSFDFDPATQTLNALEGEIQVKSVDTNDPERDEHLKKKEFFDVKNHPVILFKMIEQRGDKLIGDLSIKGITKRVEFDYEFGGALKDPWGHERAAFSFDGRIDRKDFGLSFNKTLDTGGAVVGDIVKISIEIEGVSK